MAIPILALLLLTQSGTSIGMFYGWVVVSGLIDRRLRGLIAGFFGAMFGTGAAGGCLVASLAGVVLFFVVVVVGLISVVGGLIAAVYLWINSVVTLLKAGGRGLSPS